MAHEGGGHSDTGPHETISRGSTNNGKLVDFLVSVPTGAAGIVSEGITTNAHGLFVDTLKDVVPDNIKSSRKSGGGGGGHAAP